MLSGEKRKEFLREVTSLVNRLSLENESDTPDWVLAEYLTGCLDIFDAVVRERERWYGRNAGANRMPVEDPNG